MAQYRLEKKDLGAFIENLSRQMEVIAPVKTPAGHVFKALSNPKQADLSYGNTAYSSKRFFLPSVQPLLEYPLEGEKSFKSLAGSGQAKRILLGARQCELHAINENDEFFLSRKPSDPHYKALRENTLIAVLQCKKAANEYCFCTSLGFDVVPENHDLLLQDEGDFYVVSSGSIAGDDIISKAKLSKFEGKPSKPDIRCGTVLVKGAAASLDKAFSDPIWDATAARCISCGACTLACPTCWCFDTQDQNEIGLKKTARLRVWDSCQFLEFCRVGGDFCFRRPRGSRVRHRVFHKFQYSIERFGKPTCVGCGRCLPVCLTKINPVDIMNQLHEKYK